MLTRERQVQGDVLVEDGGQQGRLLEQPVHDIGGGGGEGEAEEAQEQVVHVSRLIVGCLVTDAASIDDVY